MPIPPSTHVSFNRHFQGPDNAARDEHVDYNQPNPCSAHPASAPRFTVDATRQLIPPAQGFVHPAQTNPVQSTLPLQPLDQDSKPPAKETNDAQTKELLWQNELLKKQLEIERLERKLEQQQRATYAADGRRYSAIDGVVNESTDTSNVEPLRRDTTMAAEKESSCKNQNECTEEVNDEDVAFNVSCTPENEPDIAFDASIEHDKKLASPESVAKSSRPGDRNSIVFSGDSDSSDESVGHRVHSKKNSATKRLKRDARSRAAKGNPCNHGNESEDGLVLSKKKAATISSTYRANTRSPKKDDILSDSSDDSDSVNGPLKKPAAKNPKRLGASGGGSSYDGTKSDSSNKAKAVPMSPKNSAASSNKNSSYKKRNKQPAKKSTPLEKSTPSKHRSATNLDKETKQKLRQAQMKDDEKMKHKLLQAYEEERRESSGFWHTHYEEDLAIHYEPHVKDHSLAAGGKLFVEWRESTKDGRTEEPPERDRVIPLCTSWIKREQFLFPYGAKEYLEKVSRRITDDKEKDRVEAWIEYCEERALCFYVLNSFRMEEDEKAFNTTNEVDFCCYLCDCRWDHPLKRTTRNCEDSLKPHRPCCHGYRDEEELIKVGTFVPLARAQNQFLASFGDDGDKDDDTNNDVNSGVERLGSQLKVLPNRSGKVLLQCESSSLARHSNGRSTEIDDVKRRATVLSIDGGIGSVTVAMKQLGIDVEKMIHVESNLVAKHVYRSNHDVAYGETDTTDGIKHIVGLYDSIEEILGYSDCVHELVRKYGPIDLIVCGCPNVQSDNFSIQHAMRFFDLMNAVKAKNLELHRFDSLLFVLECHPCIETKIDSVNLNPFTRKDLTMISCQSRPLDEENKNRLFICNWPLVCDSSGHLSVPAPSGKESFEGMLGFPDNYTSNAGE